MKNFEEILNKLREGGFMSLSLKERKTILKEEATRFFEHVFSVFAFCYA